MKFTVKLQGKTRELDAELCAYEPDLFIAYRATANKFRTGKKVWPGDVEIAVADIDRLVRLGWKLGANGEYCYRFTCGHLNRNESNITPIGWADEIALDR